jgi:hypothetical protein
MWLKWYSTCLAAQGLKYNSQYHQEINQLYFYTINYKLPEKNKKTKHVYILIPKTCKYFTLHGRKDFVDVTKLRFLR